MSKCQIENNTPTLEEYIYLCASVGMGRIVGDGAPDHQKKGIGKEIMDHLVRYLNTHAPDKAFIGLFASHGKQSFYEKYHFKDYSPNMMGMFTVISR
ncbi:GNAT family N-acetyltransferase [Bacillus sp. mrc49]|uniref:GNAT family N-acetyltransferase n=1 Tax=Bacillus sp. mrc49 TaxID=2054913 RepID=UPI000C2744D3|nr:GNAT family N-acetyltransferase [Bacillus sp. mrc49]PJN87116.1 hypothetical protein CVN76_29225 [Bacillus sp. mrc49]